MSYRAFNTQFDSRTRKEIWQELRAEYPEVLVKLSEVRGESPWYRFAHLTPQQIELYQRLHNERLVQLYGEHHGRYIWKLDESAGQRETKPVKWRDEHAKIASSMDAYEQTYRDEIEHSVQLPDTPSPIKKRPTQQAATSLNRNWKAHTTTAHLE